MQAPKKIKSGDWLAKNYKAIIAVTMGGIVSFYLAKVLKNVVNKVGSESARNQTQQKQQQSELEESRKQQPASYPESTYKNWADTIATAINGAGTYEDDIYDVFRKLRNNTDYLLLLKAWGNPTRKVSPDYYPLWNVYQNMTLPAALRYDMDTSEIKKVNSILQSKGIKYRI